MCWGLASNVHIKAIRCIVLHQHRGLGLETCRYASMIYFPHHRPKHLAFVFLIVLTTVFVLVLVLLVLVLLVV